MKTIKSICIFFFMTGMISCKAQQPDSLKLPHSKDNNTLLWEISGKGLKKPSYLFGTFHLLCKDDIHITQNLQQAIKNADEVYFEMDLDDPTNTLGAMFFMNMKNKTLKDLYTPAEYDRVATFFKDSLKMKISFFEKMKPMMLEALLYPRMMPCKTPSGVEMELMSYAKKQKKEIKGFETIEFQSSVFDSIPYELQAKALLKDIDSAASAKLYFSKMMNMYTSQNTDALAKIMADTTFSQGENDDLLLKNRNENWVKQLDTILKQKNIFMGVGAAHLLGDVGLIALLRKQGYTVTPLNNK